MVCFSDKTKDRMSKLVLGISIFLLILGVTVAAYGHFVLNDGGQHPIENKDYNPGFDPNVAGELLALAAGILCVVTSIFGFLTAKFKNFCFAFPFMILAILVGLLMLVGGALTSGAGGVLTEMKV
jgi:drug/metabolite transporter (DMT)-like permease